MSTTPTSALVDLIQQNEETLLQEWLREQERASTRRASLISLDELTSESREFLRLLRETLRNASALDLDAPDWAEIRDYLARLSRTRAEAGFMPSETAMFVFSLKQPLFVLLTDELGGDANALGGALWEATLLLDSLGLRTTEEYQRAREAVIHRQQRELMELSTPVVKLWDGVLAVPLIGTLDSERTQVVMETLLQGIVDTNSTMAIIDITGVPTVDTLVAQHLLKTVAAARLMGADCIISGIRPQIAQTIVHLGLTLSEVTTKATMADAIALAFERQGLKIAELVDP
jgi:rsbT co-antagonist protein RsbR